jgi:putative glutamine amidotransferase
MEFRIGISMRVSNATQYDEPRDAISRDWSNYMLATFPDSKWLFIPNIGDKAGDFMDRWDIDVLILTGGENIGDQPERDRTETAMLKKALDKGIPIIAVCRGMQLVHIYYGGKIAIGDATFIQDHKANEHDISLSNKTYRVNSFHSNKIVENSLHKDFEVIARCVHDNSIEGIRSKNILGMMWHPERDRKHQKWNTHLIKKFLVNEK